MLKCSNRSRMIHTMSDNASFTENPFRALNAKLFPENNSQGATAPIALPGSVLQRARQRKGDPGAKQRQSAPNATCRADEPEDMEENRLFLQAMSRVRSTKSRESGKNRGFALAEHCALPTAKDFNNARGAGHMPSAISSVAPDKPADPGAKEVVAKKPLQAEAASSRSPVSAENMLSDEEEEAETFLRAMSQVQPLQARGREVAPQPPQRPAPPPQADLSLQDFLDGKLEFALSFTDEYLEGHVVGLDEMTMNKLRAGFLSPEAHLDLHGLNAVQAFEALRGFMRSCWYKGLRTVLVVPGRGRNSPDGMGVLREKLQSWLTQEPFKRVVLAFCTAQAHDGGPGSVYVLLRKYRKKGRIYWERMPADADLY